MLTISVVAPTYLKQNTKQSIDLPEHLKVEINPNSEAEVVKETEIVKWEEAEDNHVQVYLVSKLQGYHTWYAFEPHIEIRQDGKLVDGIANPESSPILTRTTQAEPDIKLPLSRATTPITLPGIGKVDLYSAIVEGGSFTWAEALHGGERIPRYEAHTFAIIRMAKELQKFRDQVGKPMTVTSWYRPEPFNSRAGGARRSQHLTGGAVDIKVVGFSGRQLAGMVLPWWPGGVGIYPNLPGIVHLDVRGWKARWGF